MNSKQPDPSVKQLENAGALWIKESKAGARYLSISFEIEGKKVSVVGFKNKYKEAGDNKPDYKLFLSENKETPSAPKKQDEEDDVKNVF